jgi:hypothetical protein
MSEQIKIELTAEAQRVIDAFKEFPSWGMDAVCVGMDRANQIALANIQRKHLTGVGPFPVEEHRLGVVTNRLRGAAWASPAVAHGTMVESAIGDNVKYAEIHEFGGTVHHPARTGTARLRADAHGNLLRQAVNANLLVFAKAGHKRVKEVAYKAGAYDVEMPERAPFRTGIEECLQEYGKQVSGVLVEAWRLQL